MYDIVCIVIVRLARCRQHVIANISMFREQRCIHARMDNAGTNHEQVTDSHSAEGLQDRFQQFGISTMEIDPRCKAAQQFVESDGQQIIDRIKAQFPWQLAADYWNTPANQKYLYKYSLDEGEWRIRATLYPNGETMYLSVVSKAWAVERERHVKAFFDTSLSSLPGTRKRFPVERLAQQHKIPATALFKRTKSFDTHSVVDGLGRGLDDNVIDLIRLLNEMGLDTTSSCGGHEDGRLPYISFSGHRITEVVAFFEAWRLAGGLHYDIFPAGELAEGVGVRPPETTSLAAAQDDLLQLTTFLRSKMEGPVTGTWKFSSVAQGIRSRIQDWLRNSSQ